MVLLVFLVLAAQYESFKLPLAIILIVPMCLLFAISGVWLTGGDNNIFTQIALFVLMGLACKNAILIVEFARELERKEPAHNPVRAVCGCRAVAHDPDDLVALSGSAPMVFRRRRSRAGHAMGGAVVSGMRGYLFGLF